MALTSDEKTAAKTIADDIAEIAVEMYASLLLAKPPNAVPGFTREQAFELTKTLIVYAVNGTDQA